MTVYAAIPQGWYREHKHPSIGGSQKSGSLSKRVVLVDVPWIPRTGTRVRTKGTKKGTTVPKTRTRVYSPQNHSCTKPPFHFLSAQTGKTLKKQIAKSPTPGWAPKKRPFSGHSLFRATKIMLLVHHGFAGVTLAIFVIFTGSEEQSSSFAG